MPKPAASIDQVIAELQQLESSFPHSGLRQFRSLVSAHQFLPLYRTLFCCVPAGSRVLDWGSGNGHFSYFLSRFGYRVTAFNMEEFQSDHFAERFSAAPFECRPGDPQSPSLLPFANDQFDAVFSVGVLEHVREGGGNELASLREIYRILKPKGLFICCHLPNRYSAIEALSSLFPQKHHHAHRYTKRAVSDLCRRANLSLKGLNGYGLLPRNIWEQFPPTLRNARTLAVVWDLLDRALSWPLTVLTQNFIFVAAKESSP